METEKRAQRLGNAPSTSVVCLAVLVQNGWNWGNGSMTDKVRMWKDCTVAQVAEQFSCGQQTVLNWITKGRIKAYRLGADGAYRIPWAEIERAKAEWMYKPETGAAL